MTRAMVEERPLRVLIVEEESLVGMGLRAQLEKMGHQVAGQAASAGEAIELFKSEKPDLVLLGTGPGGEGIDVAETLLKERRCPIIVVTGQSDKALIERAATAGVFAYLVQPVGEKTLEAQIRIVVGRFAELEHIRTEKDKLESDLITRKLVERAKGILMKRANLHEDEAHRRLQQESQKRRIAMAELCKRIIESDEMMGG